ncbi:MAG TPA: hypothetical protein DHW82_10115 [Spirochaetia bacterium]|nr:MAG: hypothetical protein A2Y41_14200 [Spirochaetes bacterium GWB1_36_13]HCL57345.1 hypothetical protein [Spirochaetia bacterium]
MKKVLTQDGSFTFYSELFQENYHTLAGAEKESLEKFIIPSKILEDDSIVSVLDIGFGLGYNTLKLIEETMRRNKKVAVTAFEFQKDPVIQSACQLKGFQQEVLKTLLEKSHFETNLIDLKILWGDARKTIHFIPDHSIHCVFLDPFSPPKNPELWSFHFFNQIKKKLTLNGKILTYSSSLPVISGLIQSGFYTGYTKPFGRKRGGVIASLNPKDIVFPLTQKDLFLLYTSIDGIPNRDKNYDSKEKMIFQREKLCQYLKYNHFKLSHKKALKIFEK